MVQTVRELETAGLVSRRPDPDDARRVFIELTPAGLEVLHARRERAEDWLGHTLDPLLDPDERELLVRVVPLLSRVADPQ